MAAAVPNQKPSMFDMSDNVRTKLEKRMRSQYNDVTLIHETDTPRKRIQPITVKSARWVTSQMGIVGFPLRVDHEYWRAYM